MKRGPRITYHGRTGRPVVHRTRAGRQYIMVRKRGGGTKRLYEGVRYHTEPTGYTGKRTYKTLTL